MPLQTLSKRALQAGLAAALMLAAAIAFTQAPKGGPGRVSQLRKEAAKRGLNPNVWFHNVELVAAEKIGHETVTYVANIFKYYVAYHLIEESLEDRREAIEKVKKQAK